MNALPHPALPAFHSPGGRARTAQIQAYLEGLHGVYARYRPLSPVTLFVLSEKDWRERTRVPYGLPFQRTSKLRLYLFIPLVYPEHLLHRLRQALLPVAEGGFPGSLVEFLDLTLGHEYAHAVQVAWQLRSRRRWLDEFLANYLFLFALQRAYPDRYPLYLDWAHLLARLRPQNPRFSAYDRLRTSLADALYFQGVFALKADALVRKGEEVLWTLLEAPSPKEVYRRLLQVLPGLTDLRPEGPGPSPPGT